ncbi:MAG: RsmB/NOP family class I SAM-dependent RNA methyltransferase [Planctomycetes bacterium]|nr:RsmB/NOP family class I SAM-dependent RNA methyltransferase [Planctomycetota bacterium]
MDARLDELAVELRLRSQREDRRLREVLGDALPALGLSAEDRRLVARRCYRVLQQERRLDFALDGALRGRGEQRVMPEALVEPARHVCAMLLDLEIDVPEASRRLPRIDWQFVTSVDARIARARDPDTRFGLTWSMHDWIAARFREEFADEAAAIAKSLNEEPPLTLRANTLKVKDRDELARRLADEGVATRPTPHAPHGLVVAGALSLFSSKAFQDGSFEQQDEASQLVCHVVAPPPRGRVLDACAGAGGKTLALAAALKNQGEVLAVDPHDQRIASLVERRRRAGTSNVRSLVVAEDGWPEEVAAFARSADRILLDVPCTGIGSWRRRPDARWSLRTVAFPNLQATQAMLLDRALAHLQVGARVIYSTCTLFAAENERQVERVLARDPGLELVRVKEILGKEAAAPITDPSGTFLRLRPHVHGMDGFFAAVIRRRSVTS